LQHIFWFTGRSAAGKTTLTTKIGKLLKKEFPFQILDGDKLVERSYWPIFNKQAKTSFIKKIVKLAENLAERDVVVLVAVPSLKQKFRDYSREVLGLKYHEIYLKSSKLCCFIRKLKGENALIRTLLTFKIIKTFEVPLSPDFIINTEELTEDESVQVAMNFIRNIINKDPND